MSDWRAEYAARMQKLRGDKPTLGEEFRMATVTEFKPKQADKPFTAAVLWPIDRLSADKWKSELRPLTAHEYNLLKADIDERGILSPLMVRANGEIVDGHHRFRAAVDLGLTEVPVEVETFATDDDVIEYMCTLQLGRRNLTSVERDEALGKLATLREKKRGGDRKSENQKGKSCTFDPSADTASEIAKETGVSPRTVKSAKARVKTTAKLPHLKSEKTGAVLEAGKALKEVPTAQEPDVMAAIIEGAVPAAQIPDVIDEVKKGVPVREAIATTKSLAAHVRPKRKTADEMLRDKATAELNAMSGTTELERRLVTENMDLNLQLTDKNNTINRQFIESTKLEERLTLAKKAIETFFAALIAQDVDVRRDDNLKRLQAALRGVWPDSSYLH